MANQLKLKIQAIVSGAKDVLGLNKAVDDLGKESTETSKETDQLNQSLNGTEKSASMSGAAMAKAAALVAGFALAISKVISSARDWIDAANVQERAERKLALSLKNLTGASEAQVQALKDQASALQDVTGYGDEQTISAQAMLATFQLTAEEIYQLTPRLLDMAEASRKAGNANVDLEQISIALGKAFSDGIGSLKRYGVAMTDAQEESFKLADQSGKVKIILEALDGNFAGLAAEIGGSYEGALRKAEGAHGDLQEVLGEQITKNDDVRRATETLTGSINDLAKGITDSSAEIEVVISGLARFIEGAFGTIQAVWNTAQIIFKGFVLSVDLGAEQILYALSKITFGDLGKEIEQAHREIEASNAQMVRSINEDIDDLENAGRKMLGTYERTKASTDGLAESVAGLDEESEKVVDGQEKLAGSIALSGEEADEAAPKLLDLSGAIEEIDAASARAAAGYLVLIEESTTLDEVAQITAAAMRDLADDTGAQAFVSEDAAKKTASLAKQQDAAAAAARRSALAMFELHDSTSKNFNVLLDLAGAYRRGEITLREYSSMSTELHEKNKELMMSQQELKGSTHAAATAMRDLGDAGQEAGDDIVDGMSRASSAAQRAADEVRRAKNNVTAADEAAGVVYQTETGYTPIPTGIGERQMEISRHYGEEAAAAFMKAVMDAIESGITDANMLLGIGNKAAYASYNASKPPGADQTVNWAEQQAQQSTAWADAQKEVADYSARKFGEAAASMADRINVIVELDGKEIARSVQPHMTELDRLGG